MYVMPSSTSASHPSVFAPLSPPSPPLPPFTPFPESIHHGCYLDKWSDLYQDMAGVTEHDLAHNSRGACGATCVGYLYFALKATRRCLCGADDPSAHVLPSKEF